jgi:anti-sigma B factor antagonist
MASPRRNLKQEEWIASGSMEFEASIEERAETYSVVVVRGEVDLHTAPKLEYAMQRGAEGVEAVVVDLSRVAFIDSTALSTLMRAKDAADRSGTSLRLAAPSKAIERIFAVTGFGDYFEVYPSREAAVAPSG